MNPLKAAKSLDYISKHEKHLKPKTSWHQLPLDNSMELNNYGHTLCFYKNSIVSIGGCNQTGKFSSSFLIFHPSEKKSNSKKLKNFKKN